MVALQTKHEAIVARNPFLAKQLKRKIYYGDSIYQDVHPGRIFILEDAVVAQKNTLTVPFFHEWIEF